LQAYIVGPHGSVGRSHLRTVSGVHNLGDIVLYLAGVNKHAGFRAVGSNQWKVTAVMVFYKHVVVFSTRKITSNTSRSSEITAPGPNL
jgi:hypothetical protein